MDKLVFYWYSIELIGDTVNKTIQEWLYGHYIDYIGDTVALSTIKSLLNYSNYWKNVYFSGIVFI